MGLKCIGFGLQSYFSAILLGMFSYMLAMEAHSIKNEIFKVYYLKDAAFNHWVDIFNKLPIGMLIMDDKKIMTVNP